VGALTAKTIPAWQWPGTAQYTQMGFVSFTVTEKDVVLPLGAKLKPLVSGAQGVLKVDWVAVCCPEKVKVTMSPAVAVMLEGEYIRPPEPTVTLWVVWAATKGRARRERRATLTMMVES